MKEEKEIIDLYQNSLTEILKLYALDNNEVESTDTTHAKLTLDIIMDFTFWIDTEETPEHLVGSSYIEFFEFYIINVYPFYQKYKDQNESSSN